MQAARSTNRLSEAEYLDIERAAAFKSEFYDGEMFAMAGGSPMHSLIAENLIGTLGDRLKESPTHSLIAGNLIRALGNRLEGRGCLTFTSDLRVKIEHSGLYTYPDVSVAWDYLRFADAEQDTLVNPTLLAEVLSDATEAYDRGEKFGHYRRMASLQAYLVVSQRQPRVELFLRGEAGQWLLGEAGGLDASIVIPPLDISLPLREVFANVSFPEAHLR